MRYVDLLAQLYTWSGLAGHGGWAAVCVVSAKSAGRELSSRVFVLLSTDHNGSIGPFSFTTPSRVTFN